MISFIVSQATSNYSFVQLNSLNPNRFVPFGIHPFLIYVSNVDLLMFKYEQACAFDSGNSDLKFDRVSIDAIISESSHLNFPASNSSAVYRKRFASIVFNIKNKISQL